MDSIVRAIDSGGVVALFTVILYGGVKGWWVFGWTHRQELEDKDKQLNIMRQERDEWKDIARNATSIAESGTMTAESLATRRGRKGSIGTQ